MRKLRNIVVIIMTVCVISGLAACDETTNRQQTESGIPETAIPESDTPVTEANAPAETESPDTGKDVLVAYFSATGTTKEVAEKIAAIADADIYEIIPATPYTSADLNYNDSQIRASVEMNDPDIRPEIGSEIISLEEYTTLYIGYPIWWGDAPRIMSTFVECLDFEGITVIPFCTSGSSGIGTSADQLAEQAGSGTWISGRRFSGNVSESDLQIWLDELP